MKMTAPIEVGIRIGRGHDSKRHGWGINSWPRGFLKKGIELRDDGEPRRSIKLGSTKWDIVKKAIS